MIIKTGFFCIFLIVSGITALGQDILWEPREDLNILLPASVKVHETSGKFEDGEPFRAVHATVDLRDENLKLRALGSHFHRQTTKETSRQHHGILAINGGYFSDKTSVSLLVSDGHLISPGLTPEVNRGAFVLREGKPQILWTRAPDERSAPMIYPSASSLENGKKFHVSQAIGGGPVLIKEGAVEVTATEEGFGGSHLLRHPRSAIGIKDEHTLLLMVVDGRQPSSAGVTLPELAGIMRSVGAVEAVNLDGGGSSVMVAADEVVNIPSDIPNGDRNNLRQSASALVLSQMIRPEEQEIIIIDTDSEDYREIGLWKTSNLPNYYGNTLSRSASADQKHNRAVYTFGGTLRKRYQLATWWVVDKENSKEVAYILHHGRHTDTLMVDQSSWSGSGKWNVLGNFTLGPADSLEVLGIGSPGKMQVDAIRLVPHKATPELPVRGDQRIAVISDLNSGLGAADYQWQVDSIMERIPRIWKPDLVISGGDMVAGMGVSDTARLRKMWRSFDEHIATPLRKNKIPFAFTLGNHDGPRSYPLERKIAAEYWNKPEHHPGLEFVDRKFFPNYYSFVKDSIFFVSWEASSPEITQANLDWMEEQFRSPEAKNAALRLVMGHMPLYSVAQERDSKGNVLSDPVKLQQLLEKYKVHTYISGHQHAYYPGKRGKVEFLNTGAAGSGPRAWLDMDRKPVNTITIMDIFHQEDSIAYTTYTIKEQEAEKMALIDPKSLPPSMHGVNGHMLRRDIPSANKAEGFFRSTTAEEAVGIVSADITKSHLRISGTYHGPEALSNKPNPVALYKGRNTEEGTRLDFLKTDSNGSFEDHLPLSQDLKEWLSAGALYVAVKTDTGEVRAQLYPKANKPPQKTSIASHNPRNVYAVRDLKAFFDITWERATDPDGDFVSYTYQLALDPYFKDLVFQENINRRSNLKRTEQDWFRLLQDTPEGTPVIFFHRVIASDGKNFSPGPGKRFQLMKSSEALTDHIELPAPEYEFAGKIEHASGRGYGAQWDHQGRLWLADYRGALIIRDSTGKDLAFSPLTSVGVNGEHFDLNPLNGIGIDLDGNILVGRNRHLLKINAETGKGIAAWEVPEGGRSITSPRASEKGEIYAMSLFGEDPNYVLKQSGEDPSSFELVRTLHLEGRILSRTFDMTSDGRTLYFPDPGSSRIQKYNRKDDFSYSRQKDITSTTSGSSAIHTAPDGSIYAAVRASGISPATFHYRNDHTQQRWTLELPEVGGAEPRGIGVSPDKKVLIFCSWDKGGGFYRYVLKE